MQPVAAGESADERKRRKKWVRLPPGSLAVPFSLSLYKDYLMADYIVALTGSTELESVNEMLAAIGVAPVADLTTTTSRDAILAKTALSTVAREVLLERWRFNSEFGVQILPKQGLTWTDTDDGTETDLYIFEVPVRGESITKQRDLLRWKLSNFVNVPGAGFVNQADLAVSLSPPTSARMTDGVAQTITAISVATAAVVTIVGHKYIDGQTVDIAATDSTPVIDGSRVITVIDADTFSVPVTTTVSGSAGTSTNETPQLVFYDARLGRDGFAQTERDALYIDATWSVDFVDMPQVARDYVTKRAARRFASQVIGAQEIVGYTMGDEQIARRNLKRDQGTQRKYNIMNNPSLRRAHGNRYTVHSQIDSAHPRGDSA